MKTAITTTVPTEVLLAAGGTIVDLNNIFITDSDPVRFLNAAHDDGFPRSICAWIKGQHTILKENRFEAVVAVTTGDCSNTHAMMELLLDRGVNVCRFAYPAASTGLNAYSDMKMQIERLAAFFGVTMDRVFEQQKQMEPLRHNLRQLDKLTVEGRVTGEENHLWLVSSSDFNSDFNKYTAGLEAFLETARNRPPVDYPVKLGYIGVPPIITDLYPFAEQKGAGFLFNEVQRQFSLPSESPDLFQRYLDYTYPYDIFDRIRDINEQTVLRQLDGIVHYVQSFCHRQIQDILLKRHLTVPVLTIEGDTPGLLDERSRIRMESFIEMLEEKKYKGAPR